jgi:hypothetical protein
MHGGDHTGQIRPYALTLTHADVDGVDAGGANFDQHIARAKHRFGHIATLQNLGAAVGF